MNSEELGQLSEEYTTILESIETALTLVEESLREVRSNTADADHLLARPLSMRIPSHNSDAQIITRAGSRRASALLRDNPASPLSP
jgi:hypothetical protein